MAIVYLITNKVTESAIRTMRAMRSEGLTLRAIAGVFKVTESTASNAVRGITWAHVTGVETD